MSDLKKRESNFTYNEKMHLITIICNRYAAILEDKKTDRASVSEKNEAWKKIENEYNATSPNTVYRKAESLKMLYENKKKELRKKIAEEKKNRYLTGGGPMPNIKLDPVDEILITIINDKSIYGLDNKHDSDSVKSKVESSNEKDAQQCVYEISLDTEENEIQIINDFMPSNSEKNKVLEVGCTSTEVGSKRLSDVNVTKDVWKKFKMEDLQLPINPQLRTSHVGEKRNAQTPEGADVQKTPKTAKRRSTENIRTLTSSDVSAKYNLLLDKRLELVTKQNQNMDDEQEFLKRERKLKLELLTLKIASERGKLKQVQTQYL